MGLRRTNNNWSTGGGLRFFWRITGDNANHGTRAGFGQLVRMPRMVRAQIDGEPPIIGMFNPLQRGGGMFMGVCKTPFSNVRVYQLTQ
jgi:hypothetical protein